MAQVSGSSISFGTPVIFRAGTSTKLSGESTIVAFDPNDPTKFVITYTYGPSTEIGEVIVGTVSGMSLSFGTPVQFSTATVGFENIVFDPNIRRQVCN